VCASDSLSQDNKFVSPFTVFGFTDHSSGHLLLELCSVRLGPVREFASRDAKQVRAQLVRIGFNLACDDSRAVRPSLEIQIDCLACVVEALHACSLMIDDIQDDDEIRRGKAAQHLEIGVPLTINAANCLYFRPADLLRR
jgi:geranylgeranyl pyrophosphate synthase